MFLVTLNLWVWDECVCAYMYLHGCAIVHMLLYAHMYSHRLSLILREASTWK